MAFKNKLSFLKVKMLKEMCKHFEILSKSRNAKSSLVKKLQKLSKIAHHKRVKLSKASFKQ